MTGYDDHTSARILAILRDVTGDAGVFSDLDLPLYGAGVIDSLGTVSLIAAFEEAFGIRISPAAFDREAWSTPRALVADVERRIATRRSA